MSTMYRYTLPVEQTEWKFDGATEIAFNWEYDDGRAALLEALRKGQEAAVGCGRAHRLDAGPRSRKTRCSSTTRRSRSTAPPIWNQMTDKEKTGMRRHLQASSISQFMHGEQGALIATAKIVQHVPDMDAKFYAATQVMDEARHVEAYSRLLHEKFELAYPITPPLKALLETDAQRQPLGHDLSRHAGADRGPGAGRLPAHPRPVARTRSPPRSTPMSCRTRRATSPSAAWRCATTTRS